MQKKVESEKTRVCRRSKYYQSGILVATEENPTQPELGRKTLIGSCNYKIQRYWLPAWLGPGAQRLSAGSWFFCCCLLACFVVFVLFCFFASLDFAFQTVVSFSGRIPLCDDKNG